MHKDIIQLLDQRRVKEALTQLNALIAETDYWKLKSEAENLQTTYNYMLQYAAQGMEDPEQGKLYRQIVRKAYELTDQLEFLGKYRKAYGQFADKMRQMHQKLVGDISQLNSRRDAIKAKIAVAKTQQTINKIGASVDGAAENLSAFDKMEAKANKMLDEANAMAELNRSGVDSINDIARKYEGMSTPEVDDELAALKAKMGQN